jgi:hypothetical protein
MSNSIWRRKHLSHAVETGDTSEVGNILYKGFDVNYAEFKYIMLAAVSSTATLVLNAGPLRVLLNHPDVRTDYQFLAGNTLLHAACILGSDQAVRSLLDAKADVLAESSDCMTPMEAMIRSRIHCDISDRIRLLAGYGALTCLFKIRSPHAHSQPTIDDTRETALRRWTAEVESVIAVKALAPVVISFLTG